MYMFKVWFVKVDPPSADLYLVSSAARDAGQTSCARASRESEVSLHRVTFVQRPKQVRLSVF